MNIRLELTHICSLFLSYQVCAKRIECELFVGHKKKNLVEKNDLFLAPHWWTLLEVKTIDCPNHRYTARFLSDSLTMWPLIGCFHQILHQMDFMTRWFSSVSSYGRMSVCELGWFWNPLLLVYILTLRWKRPIIPGISHYNQPSVPRATCSELILNYITINRNEYGKGFWGSGIPFSFYWFPFHSHMEMAKAELSS